MRFRSLAAIRWAAAMRSSMKLNIAARGGGWQYVAGEFAEEAAAGRSPILPSRTMSAAAAAASA